ncbi:MAG TPA: 3-dehydroquinate synthase [Gemmatimonadaceae bacterium]|nr:3-dehydroquinate synthase [Gemmatimonadaceae bacterium]
MIAPALELHGSKIIIGSGTLDACGAELRAALPNRRIAIISDDTVAPLYAARVAASCAPSPVSVLTIPAGEASKTRKQWARLTDELLAAGFGRDSAIIALGGGVVGDLAGFVAATYMRGVPFVQVPTSLLAMIDASVGGKTGVDTAAGKNLVGAFHHPALVIADPRTLETLPAPHLRNGLAEAIKHAVITSQAEYDWLAANLVALLRAGGPDRALAEQLVRRHIGIKGGIVARDEREAGLRKTLNFGHTIGHAVESLSGYSMLHGECIAIGMIVEARIGAFAGVTDQALTGTVGWLVRNAGLPTFVPKAMTADAIIAATRSDKKARAGEVEYALPSALGAMAGADRGFGVPIDDSLVTAALAESRTAL